MPYLLAALLCALALPALAAPPVAWPQWLGPTRDGVSTEKGLLRAWPEGGPKRLYKRKLGKGFSGLTVADGHIFTMMADDKTEYAVCLNLADGAEIWRFGADVRFEDHMGGPGPRATPTFVDGKVVVVSGSGKVFALDARNGSRIWSRDLVADFGGRPPRWGYSGTPLVAGGRVYVDVGGRPGSSVVAFDLATGKTLWSSGEDVPGYSAPVLLTLAGVQQLVVFTGTKASGLSPADGKSLWSVPWRTDYDVNAATPLQLSADSLFLASGYGVGGARLQLAATGGRWTATEAWRTKSMKNQMATSVLVDGHLYGFDAARLTCLDAATGEKRWNQQGLGRGSLITADGLLFILSEDGDVVLADASPKGYVERGRVSVLEEPCWTVPSLADGRLFVRDTEHLAVFSVKAPAAAPGAGK